MPAAIPAREHVAGHGQHFASLLEGAPGRDERPALLPGLDDQHRAGEPADHTIAQREERLARRRAGHELAQYGALGLDAARRRNVEFAALLHDIGKIRVPKNIIHKQGELDDDEWAIMRRHTIEGERMLRQAGGILASIGGFVRSSHERIDGLGYPDGLRGEQIPIESRIVCACDAFSAMTTDRPYSSARSVPEALILERRASFPHGSLDISELAQPSGGTGRHATLRTSCPHGLVSSSLPLVTDAGGPAPS